MTSSQVLASDTRTALLVAAYFGGEVPNREPRFLRLLGFEYDERRWDDDMTQRPPNLIGKDVPDRRGAGPSDQRVGNIGLITFSGGPANDYMVVELELVTGCGSGKLYTIRGHSTAEWCVKEVVSPVSHRAWASHGVISYGGKLWWMDLSWGLISCDPSVDYPVLAFEALPAGTILEATTADIRKYRYIGINAGKLCYLEVSLEICLYGVLNLMLDQMSGSKRPLLTYQTFGMAKVMRGQNLNEEIFSAFNSYDDVFTEEGDIDDPDPASQARIENILSRIVASVIEDVDQGVKTIGEKIRTALRETKEEEIQLIRSYYFSTTLEDIGYEAANDVLTSGVNFDFLESCNDRRVYLLQLECFTWKILAMMQEWGIKHHELVEAWIEAAAGSIMNEHEEDDIQIATSSPQVLPHDEKHG